MMVDLQLYRCAIALNSELFWTVLDCAVLLEVRLVCLSVRAGAGGS